MRVLGICLCALLLVGAQAWADTTVVIGYGFGDPGAPILGNSAPSYVFPGDGTAIIAPPILTPAQIPTITATGQAFAPPPFDVGIATGEIIVDEVAVTQSPFGLGVTWNGRAEGIAFGMFPFSVPLSDLDANEVDGNGIVIPIGRGINIGNGPDELLTMEFGNFDALTGASLTGIVFTLTDEFGSGPEAIDVLINGGYVTTLFSTGDPYVVPIPAGVPLAPGFTISFGARDGADFAVAAMRLEVTVPEPGVLALLAVAAFMFRRRRS